MATIKGTKKNDKLKGKNKDDTIIGKAGNDKLEGKGGNDLLKGDAGKDKAWGGDGDDTIFGGSGNDKLWGDAGEDTLEGGSGNDKLYGGDGDDDLFGGTGNDKLYGGDGDDDLYGGDGADSFFFLSMSSGRDDIHDFEIGVDKIYIDASAYGFDGMSEEDFIIEHVSSAGGDSAIDLSGTGEDRPRVVLHGVDNGFDLEGSLFLV